MTKREALAKVLTWRAIAIPLSIVITYLFFGEFWKSTIAMIFINIFFTALHYLFELGWEKIALRNRLQKDSENYDEELYQIYGGD